MLEDRRKNYYLIDNPKYKRIVEIELKNYDDYDNYEGFEILQDNRQTNREYIKILKEITNIISQQIYEEIKNIYNNL